METIATPVYCFRGHVGDYTQTRWGSGVDTCVWRELLQNARDAGASRVEATLEENEEHIILTFRDNGKGMDKETLIRGMLTYSGSIKGVGAAGGFGMAKCLIVIGGPDRCEIRTQNLAVNVVGNQYEWVEPTEFVQGTSLKLFCPKKGVDSDKRIAPTANGLRMFMERSDMRGMQVYLAGERIPDRPISPDAVVVRKWEDMGGTAFWEKEVPAPKSPYGGGDVAILRHRGIWVVDYSLENVKGSVTIDLDIEPQKVLNAPRVSLSNYKHREEIEKLLRELAKSPEAVLRPKSFTKRWNGEGMLKSCDAEELAERAFFAIGGSNKEDEKEGETRETTIPVMTTSEEKIRFLNKMGELIANNASNLNMLTLKQPEELSDPERMEEISAEAILTLVWRPAIMIKNERADFEVPEKFFPETMGKHIKKVLSVWAELCREFLLKNKKHIIFGVGFVFSEEAKAMFCKEQDGTQWFLLNPLDERNEEIFKLSEEDSREELIELAAHEVGHIFSSYHDERFALALTKNLGIVYRNKPQFTKICKTAGRD